MLCNHFGAIIMNALHPIASGNGMLSKYNLTLIYVFSMHFLCVAFLFNSRPFLESSKQFDMCMSTLVSALVNIKGQ